MRLTHETYIISALSQAIADSLPIGPVTIAWDIAQTGQQFDAAISAAINLKDICMSQKIEPARGYSAVAKSDTTKLRGVRGLYIGGAGDVVLKSDEDQGAVTFVGVVAGTILPVEAEFVMTATTATNIVALY